MNNAIAKAAALVEAHEYIRRFEKKVIVVKVGGSIMDEPATLDSLIMDVCFMDAVGMRPILVHGGGKGITEAMQRAGLEAQFVQGRRYTDERTLAIVEHVLIKEINDKIVARMRELEHKAMGLHTLGSGVVFGKRLYLEGDGGRRIDIGYVGDVESINGDLIAALVDAEYIPVIAPVGRDGAGGKLNINADSVAGHVAATVKAEKLLLVSDTHGIRTSEDVNSLANSLTRQEIEDLIEQGVITAGMLPKVEACFTALGSGVNKCHIIDGRIPHSLLLEVYTKEGIGTEITL